MIIRTTITFKGALAPSMAAAMIASVDGSRIVGLRGTQIITITGPGQEMATDSFSASIEGAQRLLAWLTGLDVTITTEGA